MMRSISDNITNPSEHTLTYVIIGAPVFIAYNFDKMYFSALTGDLRGYLLFTYVFLAAKIS